MTKTAEAKAEQKAVAAIRLILKGARALVDAHKALRRKSRSRKPKVKYYHARAAIKEDRCEIEEMQLDPPNKDSASPEASQNEGGISE